MRRSISIRAWMARACAGCWVLRATATGARLAILQRSRRLLAELVRDDKLECEFAEQGTLLVYRTARLQGTDEKKHATVLESLGIEVQRLSGEQVEAMEPALKPGVVGGLLQPQDASLRPDRYVAELARRVVELGGVIESGARVEGFETDRTRITGVRSSQARAIP